MKKRILLSLSVLSLSLLQACGGDGGSGPASGTAAATAPMAAQAPAAANVGSVSAKFEPNADPRFMLFTANGQSSSRGALEQADSGAMVRLGSNALSGPDQTVDISGDAHFAVGRWMKGTVTQTSGTYTLDGKDHESNHYVAFNGLEKLPVSGQLQCTVVAATAPTALQQSQAKPGSASGSATITLDASDADIQGSLQVQAGGESVTMKLAADFDKPSPTIGTGNIFANGAGVLMALADQGGGMPGLIVGYKAQLPGGTLYHGVARFACTQ